MTEKPSDDIFALCSRFDLDQESYRVFPKNAPVTRPSDYSELPLPVLQKPESPVCPPVPADGKSEGDNAPAAQASRMALRNLWRHIELSEDKGKAVSFGDLLESSVFVYGTAGGVGATTVSATLARLLAKAGKNCALVDSRGESILPFFFGEQRVAYDRKRYAGPHASSEAAVRIIIREANGAGNDADETSPEGEWLQRSVSSIGNSLDHLVVDVQRSQEPNLPANAAPVALLVAVPDVSSLMGARALKRILSERASGSKTICVLNKFDSSLALHAEIHGWFQENFNRVLTLGRSDLISEALAEGLTVADWMPQSAITAHFLRLLTAIDNIMPASARISQKGELSLCS